MAGVLIHDVSGYPGSEYNLKIPSLTDPANIQEAMMLFHYGLDNYDGSIEPANDSLFGNLRNFDTRITGLEESTVSEIEGTINEIISSGSVGPVTLSLSSELIAPGTLEVTSDLTVLGNFTVSGSTTFVDIENLEVIDPIIFLATEQYSADVLDTGFASAYGTSLTDEDTHLFRGLAYDVSDSKWKLFSNVPIPIDSDLDYTSAIFDTLRLGILESDTVSNSGTITTDRLIVTENFDNRITLVSKTANYTIEIEDVGKIVQMNIASANTLTIPADLTTNFPIGSQLVILQVNTGQTTLTPAVGVTLNGTPGVKLRSRWSSATLVKRAANTWVAIGDLVA